MKREPSGSCKIGLEPPERTLLYQLIEEYDPAFEAHLGSQGAELPGYVEEEFQEYLKCSRPEHGFLRVRCEGCHAEHLVAFSCCPQWETICSSRSGYGENRRV